MFPTLVKVKQLPDRTFKSLATGVLAHRFQGPNHIDVINQPRPEELAQPASRRMATGEVVPVSILRDAVLRTAPQDEVRGFRFHPVRSDRFHGIDSLAKLGEKIAGEAGKELAGAIVGKVAKPAAEKAVSFLIGIITGDAKGVTKNITKDDFIEV